jgi:hypothetical protein
MWMRARIVLIGLLALDLVGAQGTAPQIVDPREDLFQSNPGLFAPEQSVTVPAKQNPLPAPVPDVAAKPDPHPAQQPAASAAEQELPANPLWAIPLSKLTEMRDRPPFSTSRRPPQAVVVAKSVAPSAPPPKPAEQVKPQLLLVGTIVGVGGGIGLFVNSADKSTVRLKIGENHKGWVLRAVAPHQVELAYGLDSAVLKLPPPDMKPIVGAPPPSLAVAAPQTQGVPSSVSPVAATQGLPIPSVSNNASQPTTNSPAGHPEPVIQTRAFDPPQPSANPFRSPFPGLK